MASQARLDPSRYVESRRSEIRRSPPWHRYAFHIRELPRRLERLAAELRVTPGGRVLDYGCAELPYRRFFGPDVTFVGADLPGNPLAQVVLAADGSLPGGDGEFDAVLSTQVLEHVADPALHLAEAYRALRPGGRLLLSTHGMFIYHPDPIDRWRWTCEGLQHVVAEAGFDVVRFEGIIGLFPTGIQFVQDAVYFHLPRLLRAPFALVVQAIVAGSDRLHSPQARAFNAQVFALIAEKPR